MVVGSYTAPGEVDELERSRGKGEARRDIYTAVAAAAIATDAILEGQSGCIGGEAIEIDAMVAADTADAAKASECRTGCCCERAIQVDAVVVRAATAVEAAAGSCERNGGGDRCAGEVDPIFCAAETHGAGA